MDKKFFEDIDYKLLDKNIVYKGKRILVEELHYYNTRKHQTLYREHVLAGDAVIIMTITDNNEFIMIKEPRTPIGKTVLAFPAGMIEKGEDSKAAALRELEDAKEMLKNNEIKTSSESIALFHYFMYLDKQY